MLYSVPKKKQNPHKLCMHYKFIALYISNQDKSTYFVLLCITQGAEVRNVSSHSNYYQNFSFSEANT